MSNDQSNFHEIRQINVFRAPIQKVWSAVATAEGLAAWFMPNDFKPIVGHSFHLDAGPFGHSPCTVTEVEPLNRLSFNWGKDWTLTFKLNAVSDNETECILIHGGWDEAKVTEFGQSHTQIRGNMSQGWIGLMKKLGGMVEEGQ